MIIIDDMNSFASRASLTIQAQIQWAFYHLKYGEIIRSIRSNDTNDLSLNTIYRECKKGKDSSIRWLIHELIAPTLI